MQIVRPALVVVCWSIGVWCCLVRVVRYRSWVMDARVQLAAGTLADHMRLAEMARTTAMIQHDTALLNYRASVHQPGAAITPLVSDTALAARLLGEDPAVVEPWWDAPKPEFRFNHIAETEDVTGGHHTWHILDGDEPETAVQAVSERRIGSLLPRAKQAGLFYVDTHSHNSLAHPGNITCPVGPDFVMVADNLQAPQSINARTVVIVGDWKKASDSWTNSDIGRMLNYLQLVLLWQPQRSHAHGIIIGGAKAQCFCVTRARNNAELGVSAKCTRLLLLGEKADAQLVAAFLVDRDASGYIIPQPPPTAGEFLGVGATAAVFAHNTRQDCVVKQALVSREDLIAHERAMLGAVWTFWTADGKDDKTLLHLADDDDAVELPNAMILTPRFGPLVQPGRQRTANLSEFCCNLATLILPDGHLKRIHDASIVHCDVRPPNIMMVPGARKAALVDFGASREAGVSMPWHHGTLRYASDRVLNLLQENGLQAEIEMRKSDDLVSLARCIIGATQQPPRTTDIGAILRHWADIEAFNPWACKLTKMCAEAGGEDADYSKILEHIQTSYKPRSGGGGGGGGGGGQ